MPGVSGEIEALIRQGRKIEAIKRLREQAGMGLGEAKRLSEALGREERGGTLSRALLVWLLIAAAETVHGMLRTLLLVPALGDLRARQIGVVSGSLIILVIAFCSIDWIGARGARQLLGVGLLWVVLMAGFEVLVGRLLGYSWPRIASDINPGQGGFLLVGMAILAMAPFIAAAMRSRA